MKSHSFIFLIITLLIGLIILVRYKLLFSSTLTLPSRNFSLSSSWFKASNDQQLFVFPNESSLVRLYLDIVRDTVCGLTLRTQEHAAEGMTSVKLVPLDIRRRITGQDWPATGITMVGQKRLMNIEWSLRLVIAKNVRGDFIECGVWRGGSSIFARAVLKALNIKDRHVWLVDSFQGLPRARTSHDDDGWSKQEYLRVLMILISSISERLVFCSFRFHLKKSGPIFNHFIYSMIKCISVKAISSIPFLDVMSLKLLFFEWMVICMNQQWINYSICMQKYLLVV